MKKLIIILLMLPALCFAKEDRVSMVRNSPLHPWFSNGGTDMIVSFSKINFDARLLKEVRKHREVGYPFFNLSGKIDVISSAIHTRCKTEASGCPFNKNATKYSTKILTAKMHGTSVVNRNVIGHIAIKFKQNKNQRIGLDLDRAFITIDTSEVFPVFPAYITLGKLFTPFGTHSTNQVSEPLTSSIGKVEGEMIKVGINISECIEGTTFYTTKNETGLTLKFKSSINKTKLDIGVSYINKLSQKVTVDGKTSTNNVGHSVMPYFTIEYNKLGIRTELLSTLTKKHINKYLQAFRVESFYSFIAKGKFYSTALGYETMINKSIADQPRYRINATINAVFLPYTYSSFEVRFENGHDRKKSIGAFLKFGIVY